MATKKRIPSKKPAKRALPLRRVTRLMPDTRSAAARREIRRQSLLAAKHDAESDVDDFNERLYADIGGD